MLLSLAWRNLWRQKTRTILSMLSMGFASALLVFMLSLQLGTYATMKNNVLRVFDGFAQIQPQGYADDPEITKTIPDASTLIAGLEQIDGVSAASARGSSFAILANGDTSYGAAIIGVDPKTEPQVSTLGASITQGRYLSAADSDAIVMGDALARNLGVKLGQRVTLLGSAADRSIAADSLKLVGLFHSGIGQLDRQIAQMPLARFQDTFAMPGGANIIALVGPNLSAVNHALPDLRALAQDKNLVVRSWGDLQPGLQQAITLDISSASTIYVSLVVVVVFIILNTLLMSVLERTREFGVLLAIGMKPGPLGRMMWIELILLAVLGSVAGIVVGGSVAFWFQLHGIPLASLEGVMAQFGLPGAIYPALSPLSVLVGPSAIVLGVAVGGIVPYLRIRRLEPVAAMGAA
jgi:putative ABC transport system permease protein